MRVCLPALLCIATACSRSPARSDHNAPSPSAVPSAHVAAPSPSASAAPDDLAEYSGPAGLHWGQSPADAKKVLSATHVFLREDSADRGEVLEQVWGGDFSGFATESIAVDFFDQKRFVAFGAVLLAKDVQPASQRWLDLVKATTKMHGAPSRFAPPPEQVDAGTAAYDALDKRIAGGEWEPLALWNFKGGAAILIKVEVGMLDNNGNRSLKPVWLAMTTP